MSEAATLLWHVHARDELIAATRYAIHAAGMALTQGTGARSSTAVASCSTWPTGTRPGMAPTQRPSA